MNTPEFSAVVGTLFKSAKGIVLREDAMSIILLQITNGKTISEKHDKTAIEQTMGHIACRAMNDTRNPRPVIRIIFSLSSEEGLSCSKSTITLDNGVSVITHDLWCGGIGDFLLPDDDESKSSWKALLSATMKSEELFEDNDPKLKDFAAERVYVAPGGSDRRSFWG